MVDGERRVAVAAAHAFAGEILKAGGEDRPDGFPIHGLAVEDAGLGFERPDNL